MPSVNNKLSRAEQKAQRVIPGAKFLHRGIHIHENKDAVAAFKTNATAKRLDHRDLFVHHQKINDALQDVYQRAGALEGGDLSREDREEQRWAAFERIGGKRPQKKVGYAKHLEAVRSDRTEERRRAEIERSTGDIDCSKGSALHNMKDRRVKKFVQRQLDRAKMLERMGDPTPMKQSGKFDRFSGTLHVFNKTKRQVDRAVASRERELSVKAGRGGKKRSMWDMNQDDGSKHVLRDASFQMNFARRKKAKQSPRGKR